MVILICFKCYLLLCTDRQCKSKISDVRSIKYAASGSFSIKIEKQNDMILVVHSIRVHNIMQRRSTLTYFVEKK